MFQIVSHVEEKVTGLVSIALPALIDFEVRQTLVRAT